MANKIDPLDALGSAYEKMYERTAENINKLKDKSEPLLQTLMDKAKNKAIELEELTEQEAIKVSEWLKRDIDDAASYLTETGNELKDWLGYESTLLESAVLDLFLKTADKTTLTLLQLKESGMQPYSYHTGEITGPGTLVCDNCEAKVHFYNVGKISVCPKCQGTSYHR